MEESITWGSSEHKFRIDSHLSDFDTSNEFWSDVCICLTIACHCPDSTIAVDTLNTLHWGLIGALAMDIALKAYSDCTGGNPLYHDRNKYERTHNGFMYVH